MRLRPALILAAVGFALGLFFSGFSTFDFVSHLDRQVHGLHCSFIPGLTSTDVSGTSGCHVTLMSPYSSVFRQDIWGGLPISLPAMGVFAFLLAWTVGLFAGDRSERRGPTGFLALGALLPVLASCVMAYISITKLGATCKLCVGTYAASALAFLGAVIAWRQASAEEEDSGMGPHLLAFLLGCVFVAAPVGTYVLAAPDFGRFVGQCGTLPKPEDPHKVMIDLPGSDSGIETIEVFDPLCPSCKGFEDRLAASGLAERLARKAVLFPLDDSCNWMVGSALHPGACDVSEAILCAGDRSMEVIDWAFAEQEAIRTAAAAQKGAAADLVKAKFPDLAGCIGKPEVKTRLNRSLRWAVANQLPVLTPQLYVGGKKLCDEDTDLGMDWALARLLEQPGGSP